MKSLLKMGMTNMENQILTQNGFVTFGNEQFVESEQSDNLTKLSFIKLGKPVLLYDKPYSYNVMIDEIGRAHV